MSESRQVRLSAGVFTWDGSIWQARCDGALFYLDAKQQWVLHAGALPQPGQATLAALDMVPVPTRAREAVDRSVARQETKASEQQQVAASGEPACPKCSGRTFSNVEENDQRAAQGQKLRPDYVCRDKTGCGWVQWRDTPKPANGQARRPAAQAASTVREQPSRDFAPLDDDDSIPF